MSNIERRLNKLEEITGQKKTGKVIFEVIGENGEEIKTLELEIRYRND